MSRASFDRFGDLASSGLSWSEIAGRYEFQESMEPRIVQDVAEKLRLSEHDTLLEIGCGAGNLLIPLSRLVKKATGVDHPKLLEKLAQRCSSIALISGNFLDVELHEPFTKVLIYSVLHYLSDADELTRFILKATGLLAGGGLLLIGDIPNLDKKIAFEADPRRREFMHEWRRKTSNHKRISLDAGSRMVRINEELLVKLCSRLASDGFEVTRVAQPDGLPMCLTREDIIVARRT